MQISGPDHVPSAGAQRILASLPDWFGQPAAREAYIEACASLPGFSIESESCTLAFLTLEQHFPAAWEIHCLAVHAEHRREGLGRQLVSHAEAWLRTQGARWLQVKTLAAEHPSQAYAETRAFYHAMGYSPLQTFPQLWSAENPCLLMIKSLAS